MIELSRSEPEFMLPGGVGMRIVRASVDEGSVSLAMEGDHEISSVVLVPACLTGLVGLFLMGYALLFG